MDVAGAAELQKRIEEQAHWQQARAVRDGRLPPRDPDALELEEIRDGIRLYRREQRRTVVDGRAAVVTVRVVKQLVGDEWQRSLVEEEVVYLDARPDAPLSDSQAHTA